MNEKKYDVNISELDNGWWQGDTSCLNCGRMTENEIKEYIRDIRKQNIIPEDSCLYCVRARFQKHEKMEMRIAGKYSSPGFLNETPSLDFDISVKMKNSRKCPAHECFKNIADGKCTDDFATRILGSRFWPDKYKEKQR